MRRHRHCFNYCLPFIPFYDSGITDTEIYKCGQFEPKEEEGEDTLGQPGTTEIWYITGNGEVISKFDGDPNEFDALYHTDWESFEEAGNYMELESNVYSNDSEPKHGIATYNRDVTYVPIFSVVTIEPLEYVYFPSSITHINRSAFIGLDLKGVYFYSELPPIVDDIADEFDVVCMFDGSDPESGDPIDATYPIFVPSGSLDAYKAASGWSKYANRLRPIE